MAAFKEMLAYFYVFAGKTGTIWGHILYASGDFSVRTKEDSIKQLKF